MGKTLTTKKNLREILEQNNLYDEVLAQINNRLSLRETMKEGARIMSGAGRSNSIQVDSRQYSSASG